MIADVQSAAESLRRQGRRIGFVPTMSFLHYEKCRSVLRLSGVQGRMRLRLLGRSVNDIM